MFNIPSTLKRNFVFDATFLKYTNTCAYRILWTIWFKKRSEFFPISTLHIFALFVSRTDFYGYCTMIESIIEIQKETPQDIPISGASSRSYGIACLYVCLRISTRRWGRCYLGWITYVYSHAFSYLAPFKHATLYNVYNIQTDIKDTYLFLCV